MILSFPSNREFECWFSPLSSRFRFATVFKYTVALLFYWYVQPSLMQPLTTGQFMKKK